MSIEIERKYLVRRVPAAVEQLPGSTIRQGYVAAPEGGIELRVRHKGERFFQTVKMGAGLARTEIEIELSREQFDQLWPYTENRRIGKTRYTLPLGEHSAEIDRFEGRLSGLILVEVEFPSVEASHRFRPPEWFGREVTEDGRYTNSQLAVHGIPE